MATWSFLVVAVVASALFAAAALLWMVLRTFAFQRAPAAPSGWKGIAFAFGQGMLPWEKESAGGHWLTLAAGVIYHAGVFVALLQLFARIPGLHVPLALIPFAETILLLAFCSGTSLLIKRALLPTLRALSCPDDYAANVIVNLFLLFSFLTTLNGAWVDWLLGASLVFFLYLPLGKVRHCVFFFYTRVMFGLFFGRRAVLPHPRSETNP